MNRRNGSVTLVSNFNSQLHLLVDYLNKKLDCPIAVSNPESASLSAASQHDLILLDADCMNLASMQAWHPDLAPSRHVILAAFNVQDELQAYTLVTGLKLRGVFYRHDTLELFCKGIETLQTGRSWMSRSLMAQVVDAFHRQQRNTYQPVCGLTQRETQILGLLSAGATNKEIAEYLFVSLHTVKSHLYKIFRKIEVRNRIEAVNWSRQYLGTPQPLELIAKRDTPNIDTPDVDTPDVDTPDVEALYP